MENGELIFKPEFALNSKVRFSLRFRFNND